MFMLRWSSLEMRGRYSNNAVLPMGISCLVFLLFVAMGMWGGGCFPPPPRIDCRPCRTACPGEYHCQDGLCVKQLADGKDICLPTEHDGEMGYGGGDRMTSDDVTETQHNDTVSQNEGSSDSTGQEMTVREEQDAAPPRESAPSEQVTPPESENIESCTKPTEEKCNNQDDDCNGKIDDNLQRSCSSVCGQGVEICSGGQWGACSAPQPTPEVCDGKDNDCNGQIDEGCCLLSIGGQHNDVVRDVVVDHNGNVYIAGSFTGTAVIAGQTVNSLNIRTAFVAKLDAQCQKSWVAAAFPVNQDSWSESMAVSVDRAGNVYITGYLMTSGTTGSLRLGNHQLQSPAAGRAVWAAKLDVTGSFAWAKTLGYTSTARFQDHWMQVHDIAVDKKTIANATADYVYIIGESKLLDYANTTIGGTVYNLPLGSSTRSAVVLFKLDAKVKQGNSPNDPLVGMWGKDGQGFAFGMSVVVDQQDTPHIAGHYTNTAMFGLTTQGGYDLFVAKLDKQTLQPLWARSILGTKDETANAMTLDTAGNSYLLATTKSPTLTFPPTSGQVSFGSTSFTMASNQTSRALVVKLLPDGSFGGVATAVGDSLVGRDIVADNKGNLYLTGSYQSPAILGTLSLPNTLSVQDATDVFVARLSSTGTFTWAETAGSTGGANQGHGIAWAAPRNLYTVGQFQGTATFYRTQSSSIPITLSSASNGSLDGFLWKMLVDPP